MHVPEPDLVSKDQVFGLPFYPIMSISGVNVMLMQIKIRMGKECGVAPPFLMYGCNSHKVNKRKTNLPSCFISKQ